MEGWRNAGDHSLVDPRLPWPTLLASVIHSREDEAPAEPNTTAGRRPPEAPYNASGGRRAKARVRLGRSLALPFARYFNSLPTPRIFTQGCDLRNLFR